MYAAMLLFGLGMLLCFVFYGSMVCCYASVRNERLIYSLLLSALLENVSLVKGRQHCR